MRCGTPWRRAGGATRRRQRTVRRRAGRRRAGRRRRRVARRPVRGRTVRRIVMTVQRRAGRGQCDSRRHGRGPWPASGRAGRSRSSRPTAWGPAPAHERERGQGPACGTFLPCCGGRGTGRGNGGEAVRRPIRGYGLGRGLQLQLGLGQGSGQGSGPGSGSGPGQEQEQGLVWKLRPRQGLRQEQERGQRLGRGQVPRRKTRLWWSRG